MSKDTLRTLKHDVLSNLGSIFSAIRVLKETENLSADAQTVIELIMKKENNFETNIKDLLALVEEGQYSTGRK